MRSIAEKETARLKAWVNPAGASLPCTGELNRKTEPLHSRRFKILRKSCKAAPLADDMIATRRAKVGKVFFGFRQRGLPSGVFLEPLELQTHVSHAILHHVLTRSWCSPRGSYR